MSNQVRSHRLIRFWSILLVGALLFAPVFAGGEDDPAVGTPTVGTETVSTASMPSEPETPQELTDLLVWWLTLGLLF